MHRFFSLIFSLIFVFSCSFVYSQTTQYENLIIEKIDIEIANPISGSTFNSAIVTSRIKTKEGDFFSQHSFDSDLKVLAEDYDKIEPYIEIINDKMLIKLKIWLKPHIRTIQFEGNSSFSSPDLLKELGVSPGIVYDRIAFNKCFHKLKTFYIKKGFFETEIDYIIDQDPISNEIDIKITVIEGRSGKIKDIVFHNFTCKEEEELLECMVTKKWNLFTSWFNGTGIYNEEAMHQDQYTIVGYLQNEGYADAKVSINVCEATTNNRIIIHITADKGQIYTFGKFTIEGNDIFCEEDITRLFTICEGGVYSPDAIRDTVSNIVNLYGSRGYIDAVVDFEPTLDGDQPVYCVHFSIEEGEQYYVGLIKVFGNCSTQTNVILHETLLIPGEVFNSVRLKKTEERLQNIGYFKCVNVYAVKSEGLCGLGENYRDIHIEVEETSTGNFSAFLGFSNVESIFGGFHVTENNFNFQGLGRCWKEGYSALRGAGEYAHFTTTIGAKSRSYVFSWAKPHFRDTPWIIGFDLERSNVRYISDDYAINSSGLLLHAKYPFNPYLRFGWHYRMRYAKVHVHEDKDEPAAFCQQLKDESRNDGFVSATGVSLIYDSTDCPRLPNSGFRSRLEFEFAGVGGRNTFLGFGYLNTLYLPIPFFNRCLLKLRGDVKFLVPVFGLTYERMPIDERLFLGGDNTVRGYESYALGPKFCHGLPNSVNEPRGGLSLNLFSAEYVWRYSPRFEAFTFFDAGHLSARKWSFGGFKTSVGFGVRVTILESAPPFTLGLGYPLNANKKDDVKHFFFSIGGNF